VVCRYNLKGLSVRGMCPECGTSVRTTLLAVVDPMAKELRRIGWPRAIAGGLVLWPLGALLATLTVWTQRAVESFGAGVTPGDLALFRWLVLAGLAISALGAALMIRPHEGIPARDRAMAAAGVLAYVPLAILMMHIQRSVDGLRPPYAGETAAQAARALLRVGVSACMVVTLIGLRPNARTLQARWLLMRLGAVGRQTLLAMVGVVLVWSVGDGLALLATRFHGGADELLWLVARGFILVGSLLFTLGLFGVLRDTLRVAGIILRPARSLEELTRPGAGAKE
jgi:hypothetical protein